MNQLAEYKIANAYLRETLATTKAELKQARSDVATLDAWQQVNRCAIARASNAESELKQARFERDNARQRIAVMHDLKIRNGESWPDFVNRLKDLAAKECPGCGEIELRYRDHGIYECGACHKEVQFTIDDDDYGYLGDSDADR